jgi:hypothetical protein
MTVPAADEREDQALIKRAARGDPAARDSLLDRHRERLRTMAAIRMDHRLAARVDPSDVVREEPPLSDDSIRLLGNRLAASGTSPSRHLARDEFRERMTRHTRALEKLRQLLDDVSLER